VQRCKEASIVYRTLHQNNDRSASAVAEGPGGEAEEGASQRSRGLGW
jgi:hypothetical protein